MRVQLNKRRILFVTSHLIHRDPPCHWTQPRAYQDASARYRKHGPVQPMEYDEPGLLARLFGRRP